jgi:15-cis-phytoene synthase
VQSASERLTRESGTSFYYAFRILPPAKRQAIFALYSFCREVDDCVDEPGGGGAAGLDAWLAEVDRAYADEATTPIGRDLARALERFPIPRECFEAIVAGCRMDLTPARYATFAALRVYCERVASAVGLASIEIFGYRRKATREYARELGLALQLTNILRDVTPDAAAGRIYVPLDELARFGVSEAVFLEAARRSGPQPAMQALLAFQAERALACHRRAATLLPPEDRRSMASARIMGAVYLALLQELASRGFPLGGPRLGLGRSRKLWIAFRTLAATALGA